MGTNKLIPELRFRDFKKNWSTRRLGDIATFSKGRGISKADIDKNGNLECIRYGELYTEYSEVIDEVKSRTSVNRSGLILSQANDVIIPASGETQIDIATASCVLRSGIALGGDLNIIRTEENGVFLSYYINNAKKKEVAKLAQGNSVVHLYSSQLKTIQVNLPEIEEQKKIADFLTAVNQRIQLLRQKKEALISYKAVAMQLIFSQKMRFKDERGNSFPNWENRKLEFILDYEQPNKYLVSGTEYKDHYTVPVLTAGKTFILGYTDETNGIFKEKLPTIIFDDFTTAFKFVDFPFKAKSSAMKMLIPKNEEVNLKFVFEAMKTIKFPVGEHKRYWISEFQKEVIPYPTIDEQNRISDFLSELDKAINSIIAKIDYTNKFKEGLLKKILV